MSDPSKDSPRIADVKLTLIESLVHQKNFKQALAEIRDIENGRKSAGFLPGSADLLYSEALALQGLGNYKEACERGKRALNKLKKTSQIDKLARAQYVLGTIYFDMGELRKAEQELRDAIASCRRIDDNQGITDIYGELAHLHFVRSDYDRAIELLEEGLSYCREMKDHKRTARFSGNLGTIYLRIGKWKEAKKNLLLSLESNKTSNNLINISCCYLSLGYICFLLRDFSQSKENYEKALKLIYDNNYAREMAIYYEYYGELAFAQGNYFLAEDHFRNGIKIGEEIAPSGDIVSQTYRLLAEVQIAEGEYEEALSSSEKALNVATSLGEKIEMGAIHRALGQIHSAKKDQLKARDNFEKSISILEQIGAKFELGKAYLEAVRSNVFEYVDCIAHYANGREIFTELGSHYHLGRIALAFCEFLFEIGEYDKAEVYLREPEKIFKRLDEKKDLDLALQLRGKIDRALGKIGSPKTRHRTEYHFSDIVTQDAQMLALMEEARRFKDSDVPILLEGDTGTGKDLLAKVIHCESKRKHKRFVKVNCAAIPETLLESELFGYKRGAFSGADKDKKGLFEEADGGTILLNEIGDLPLRLQAKILDVIEDKELTRLGEVKPRKVNFRVIAATSKDLSEEVGKGDFREDLYHRLNVVSLRLPPLRERKSDIPLLIRHFLANSSIKIDWEDLDFQPYLDYHWPGNVRELENEFRRHSSASELVKALGEWDKTSNEAACGKLTEMERRQIVEAVGTTGSKREAAGLLGISLATLYRKMKLHNLAL